MKVNPTRINLLRLKKELKTAEKGYKLLKDKRDGLVKTFMEVIRDARKLRQEVNEELPIALRSYIRSSSSVAEKIHDIAFLIPNTRIDLDVSTRSIMSVPIPEFKQQKHGRSFAYGILETSGELDLALTQLDDIMPKLIRLAELEKSVENLAEEIEKTRRRTSALENVRIPELKKTIRFINLRLEEQARDATVSTMRIKAMIEEKERAAQEG